MDMPILTEILVAFRLAVELIGSILLYVVFMLREATGKRSGVRIYVLSYAVAIICAWGRALDPLWEDNLGTGAQLQSRLFAGASFWPEVPPVTLQNTQSSKVTSHTLELACKDSIIGRTWNSRRSSECSSSSLEYHNLYNSSARDAADEILKLFTDTRAQQDHTQSSNAGRNKMRRSSMLGRASYASQSRRSRSKHDWDQSRRSGLFSSGFVFYARLRIHNTTYRRLYEHRSVSKKVRRNRETKKRGSNTAQKYLRPVISSPRKELEWSRA